MRRSLFLLALLGPGCFFAPPDTSHVELGRKMLDCPSATVEKVSPDNQVWLHAVGCGKDVELLCSYRGGALGTACKTLPMSMEEMLVWELGGPKGRECKDPKYELVEDNQNRTYAVTNCGPADGKWFCTPRHGSATYPNCYKVATP
ncbi:MAG: hypothetical protein KC731_15605 [Myxococcales bacterium]|nr:hypothetical protein [Myxococcales bacterium]